MTARILINSVLALLLSSLLSTGAWAANGYDGSAVGGLNFQGSVLAMGAAPTSTQCLVNTGGVITGGACGSGSTGYAYPTCTVVANAITPTCTAGAAATVYSCSISANLTVNLNTTSCAAGQQLILVYSQTASNLTVTYSNTGVTEKYLANCNSQGTCNQPSLTGTNPATDAFDFLYDTKPATPTFQEIGQDLNGPPPVPVTSGGTGLTSGTSGGVPYFNSTTTMLSSAALTSGLPVIGGGAGGAPTVGTVTGNTTKFVTGNGTYTNTHDLIVDANGNVIDGSLVIPTTATTGDIIYATAANTIGKLADVTTGQVLASGGVSTAPAYTANPAVTSISTGTSPPNLSGGNNGVFECGENTTDWTPAAGVDFIDCNSASHTFVASFNGGSVVRLVRSWAMGSANAVVSNSAANVFPFQGNGTAVATTSEGTVASAAPAIATIQNMECYLTSAAGTKTAAGGTNYVLAVRQNLATSAITCTIATAATNCQDTTHTITTAVGDQLDFIDTPSGTPTALIPHCSVEIAY